MNKLLAALPNHALDILRYAPVHEPNSRYLASWRGGSAILVLIGHGFDIFHRDPHPIWSILATSAVLVFFGLSGFFIHKALAKSVTEGETRSFVVGRVNRIVPPFVFSLILVTVLWAVAPAVFSTGSRGFVTPTARSEFSLDGFLPTLLFLNGFAGPTLSANGPLWSLSYEIWYYMAACLGGAATIGRRKWLWAVAAVLLIILTAASPRFGILGVVWGLGFALSAAHGLNRVPKVPEAPALITAVAAVLLAAFDAFKGAQLLANLAVGCWFIVHMAQVLNGKQRFVIGALEWSSHFAYALYVLHFPLLLFIYGAVGERASAMVPAMLLILAGIALFGPQLESIKLISRTTRQARRG